MAKPFGMYSYSNKLLKNLPAPPRQPVMVEVEAEDLGILVIAVGTSLYDGTSTTYFIHKEVGPWYRRRHIMVPGGSSLNYTSARRDVYEKEIRRLFNDYTTPANELFNKYKDYYAIFRQNGII